MTTDDAVSEELAAQQPYDDYEPIGRVLAVWAVVFAVVIVLGFKGEWGWLVFLAVIAVVAPSLAFWIKRREGSR